MEALSYGDKLRNLSDKFSHLTDYPTKSILFSMASFKLNDAIQKSLPLLTDELINDPLTKAEDMLRWFGHQQQLILEKLKSNRNLV